MADATLEQTVAAILKLANKDPAKKMPTRKAVVDELAQNRDALNMVKPLTLDMGIYGQATQYARQQLDAAKAPVVAKTLDSTLIDLFLAKSAAKPMLRYDQNLMTLIKQAPSFTPVQERMIQKLVTVMAQCEHQHTLDSSQARARTVRSFVESTQPQQMQVVNALWDECTVGAIYDKKSDAMVEADNAVSKGGTSQLPSSVHPVRSGNEAKEFTRGRSGKPFTSLKVGFRVEGSFDRKKGEGPDKLKSDIERILSKGMVPQVTIDWLMMNNGKDIEGTKVALETVNARLNIEQKDLWNESGVCVARSFFGSTAFPLRDHDGQALLWAVDVEGLTGYDTEAWQLANRAAGSGPWRPGEKCFAKVPATGILGYVVIDKLGDGGSGWKFSVPRNAKWQALGASGGFPTPGQVKYIEDELAAWAGVTASVPTDFDFQSVL